MKIIFAILHLACLTGSVTFGSSVYPTDGERIRKVVNRKFRFFVGPPNFGTAVRVGTRVGLGRGGVGVETGVSTGGGVGVGTGVGVRVGAGLGAGKSVNGGAGVGGVVAGIGVNNGMRRMGVGTVFRSSGRTPKTDGHVDSVGVGVVVPVGSSLSCDPMPCYPGLPQKSIYPVLPRNRRSALLQPYRPRKRVYRRPFIRVQKYSILPVFRPYPTFYD